MSKIDIYKRWNYTAALESSNHIQLQNKYNLFINGQFVKPLSKKYFKSSIFF